MPPNQRQTQDGMKNKPGQNKKLVLEAFDALFNKRDYAAAETFWSPDYIQHIFLPVGTVCSTWSKPVLLH